MRALGLAVGLLLALAPAAHAGVVQVSYADSCAGDSACTKYGAGFPVAVASFNDPDGAANALTVTRAGAEVTFTDPAAPLTAGSGCTPVDEHTARCPVGDDTTPVRPLVVDTGAGDDAITVGGDLGVRTPLRGGDGNDVISGGAEDDEVDGGAGIDRLAGNAGADTLDFAARTTRVVADLEAGTAAGDTVTGFERVLGGSGNDRLVGSDAGDEVLDGGAGDDLLLGRAGQDALYGGEGDDRIEGGYGDDLIETDPEQGDDFYTPVFTPGDDVARGQVGDDRIVDRAGGENILRGGPGRDRIDGGPDQDLMDGGPGDDRLFGDTGVDRYLAGGGRDRVDARDGDRERVDCGLGRDRVKADKRDRLRRCAP